MKNSLIALVLIGLSVTVEAQTLYVPSGTSGIGNNTTTPNVGIGTATPTAVLHLKSLGSSTYTKLEKASSSYEAGLEFASAGTSQFFVFTDDASNALKFEAVGLSGEADATPRMELPFTNKNIYLATSGGNVGIGTNNPQNQLEVVSGNRIVSFNVNLGPTLGGILALSRPGDGAKTMFFGPSEGPNLDNVLFGNGGSSEMRLVSGGLSSGGFSFYLNMNAVTAFGSARPSSPVMRIDGSGNVGVGTASPDSKLSVKGLVHAQEVKIDLNGAVAPDYVFENNYKLPSLETVKSYITKNRHLPEVPSGKELETQGMKVGEMNLLLLKKIEELTLYVIQQEERIKELESKMK